MSRFSRLKERILSPSGAEGIVPPSGFTAWLVTATAFAMAALAVCALSAAFASGRLADRWSAELARSSTVTILAPEDEMEAQTQAALNAVQTTEGVVSARSLSREEQADILLPWLGTDLTLDVLPVPRVIVVEETFDGPDPVGLRLRLAGEAPDAVYDDHTRWRRPMVEAANRLRIFSIAALALIGLATAAMVTLAARAALAANVPLIGTLRLIGARDSFIARAFVRRFTLRALLGSVLGTALASLAFFLMPQLGPEAAFSARIGPSGWQWAYVPLVPITAAITALIATRLAAFRTLRHLQEG